jgi:hypothetical protein
VNGVEEAHKVGDAFYVGDAHTLTPIAGSELV